MCYKYIHMKHVTQMYSLRQYKLTDLKKDTRLAVLMEKKNTSM